jgi:uncharacterized membrane protein (DUF106 family)
MEIVNSIIANPKASIIIISLLVTIFMTVVRYFATDKKLMREIKEKQKWIKEEMKKYRDNADKTMELNKQMMEHFPAQMKQTFKLMLLTLIPLLILLGWLREVFAQTAIASTWIWWYVGFSMVFGIILGKIFKLD